MIIHGLNKLTLLDYPEHTACTVFTGGCNFRCPFCHNATLVFNPDSQPVINEEEFFSFLNKRKGLLEGVCITGGEPTITKGLEDFIGKIKDIGLNVKLDTNGSRPEVIRKLLADRKVDYIAMDIKNSLDAYGKTIGIENFNTAPIEESVKIIMDSDIDYEFRTTVVKEYHDTENFIKIGQWLKGAKLYVLQDFRDGEDLITSGLGNHTEHKMQEFCQQLTPFFQKVLIRGKNL